MQTENPKVISPVMRCVWGGEMEKLDIALCEASSGLPNREKIVTRFDQALHLEPERRLD